MRTKDSVKKNIAIVLAGGKGSRMKCDKPKQYIEINGNPILYYSLIIFQNSFIDEIILVAGKDEIDYCKKEIVEKYKLTKVTQIIEGGEERYNSVYNGLNVIDSEECEYVYIHDGARPCITEEILQRCHNSVQRDMACAVAMPVKDTIKIVDANGFAISTPDRSSLWQVQTPQVFEYNIVKESYDVLMQIGATAGITDDAMVVEHYGNTKVKMVEGSYENIKVTTPEDMEIVAGILAIHTGN